MCQICETNEQRIRDLLNQGDEIHKDQPFYLVRNVCTSSNPCGGGQITYGCFIKREDFIEFLKLLPYFYGGQPRDCDTLKDISSQVSQVVDEYDQGRLPVEDALDQLNELLYPTDVGITVMGSGQEFISSPAALFAEYRQEARTPFDRDATAEDLRPFDDGESDAFINWISAGLPGLEEFSLAADEE